MGQRDAQGIMFPAAKPEDLHLMPWTRMAEGRKEDCLQVVLWPPQTYSCSNTHNTHTLNVTGNFGFFTGWIGFVYVWVFFLYVCQSVHHVCPWCPWGQERVSGTVGYIDGCELPCGYWASNPGPLLQQCGEIWMRSTSPIDSYIWVFGFQFMELMGGIKRYGLAGGVVSQRVSFELAKMM